MQIREGCVEQKFIIFDKICYLKLMYKVKSRKVYESMDV